MTHFRPLMIACALAITIAPFAAYADPKKDESGKGGKYEESSKGGEYDKSGKDNRKGGYEAKDRDDGDDDFAGRDWDSYDDYVGDRSRRDRSEPYFRDRYSRLDIPYGHYPPPGECRVWYPDRPPGQQPPPGDCRSMRSVPRGAWLIRRPQEAAENVYINARGNPSQDIFDVVGIFDPATGRLLREIEGR